MVKQKKKVKKVYWRLPTSKQINQTEDKWRISYQNYFYMKNKNWNKKIDF